MSFQVRRVTASRKKRCFPWARLPLIIGVLRPLAGWYRSWKTRKEEETRSSHRTLILKRFLLVLIAVLCAFLLLAGTVKALVGLHVISIRSLVSLTGAELPKDEQGFTNILLLGEGDATHDGKDLTDTIMVVSIDPAKTKSAVLLSLPRDLYFLKSEKMGKGRINSLYRDYKILLRRQGKNDREASLEAMKELGAVLGGHLNLTIHHVIKVNFTGFEQAIDAIGGIDVTVPEAINDTEYPDENYGFEPFSIAAGPAHLDGKTALKYARSRHTTSDFGRSARQQQIIVAIGETVKKKGLYKNPATVTDLLKVFSDNVVMTMTVRELIGLAGLAEDVTPDHIITMQLNDRNGLYDGIVEPGGFLYTPPREQFEGASVLLPVSIPEFPVTWKQIERLSAILFRQRAIALAHPKIAILNAGAKSGLARKLGGELIRYGYDVQRIENMDIPKAELKASNMGSYVYAKNPEDATLKNFFADLLHLPIVTHPVPLIPEGQMEQIVVVISKDYGFQPLQDLLTTP
ncbi:MAG: LCP family protein [Candidatus Peribacter sp.]|nr:LCP family protein [Candidatus Peribacter sp.]